MKRTVPILVLLCIALSLGAITAGTRMDVAIANYESEEVSYAIHSVGGSLITTFENHDGLGLTTSIGVAYAPKAQLNGNTVSGYGAWGPTCYHYTATIGASYRMPTDFGVLGGIYLAYNDVVFQHGGRLTEWKRYSIHCLGWGWEAGICFKTPKRLTISITYRMEKSLASWGIYRTRENWDTSAPEVQRLDGDLTSHRISIALTASK